MSATYRVVIKGIRYGFSKEQVVGQLASLFKITEDQARNKLEASSFVVKKGIDLQTTEKYLSTLEQRGCICIIEPEHQPTLQDNHSQDSKKDDAIETTATQSTAVISEIPHESPTSSEDTANNIEASKPAANKNNLWAKPIKSWNRQQWASIILFPIIIISALYAKDEFLGRHSHSPTTQIAATEIKSDKNIPHLTTADLLPGTWNCTSSIDPNFVYQNIYGAGGEYEDITDIGGETHRIGTYSLTKQTLNINITRIPELAQLGQSPNVAVNETATITHIDSSTLQETTPDSSDQNKTITVDCKIKGDRSKMAKTNDLSLKWTYSGPVDEKTAAEIKLAKSYLKGEGVPKDFAKAFEILSPIANQGNADAQNNIGQMYYWGAGIAKDYAQALDWFTKSAKQGNPEAQYYLGTMYITGVGVTKDYTQALAWFQKSAAQGNPDAQNSLGTMYVNGVGVAKNFSEGLDWLQKSAAQGNALALKSIDKINKYQSKQKEVTANQSGDLVANYANNLATEIEQSNVSACRIFANTIRQFGNSNNPDYIRQRQVDNTLNSVPAYCLQQ
jgi:TPR repeat protein